MSKKRGLFKKLSKIFSLVIAAIVIGVALGNTVISTLQNKLKANYIISDYQEKQDFDFTATVLPNEIIASDAYHYAIHALNNQPSYDIKGNGIVKIQNGFLGEMRLWGGAKKKDSVINTYVIAHNNILSNYCMGIKYDYYIEDDMIDFYHGKSNSDGTAIWDNPKSLTPDEYFKDWGLSPNEFFTYTISRTTAIENSNAEKIITSSGKSLYKYTMKLNADTSTINYGNQMQKVSGLSRPPTFKEIVFEFTVDENFVFQSVEISEIWSIYYYGLLPTCTSKIVYDFTY